MTAQQILDEIKPLGRDSYKSLIMKHGVPETCYGVKIEELKKIQKRIKKDYQLALDLYDTGIYDAMYLAGLIADDAQMTRKDLQRWVAKACRPLAAVTVAWVAAGSPHGWAQALEWIDSSKELEAIAGWSTLSGVVSIKDDADLDLAELKRLLLRVQKTIHTAPNRVRYQMNGFVICVGGYVTSLTELALEVAAKIGKVNVDMGETECKVPSAAEYIRKMETRGNLGKKRKTVKC
jgi:hypothetical protein